jgi:CxxC motif-containing protein (DUF1111 family)
MMEAKKMVLGLGLMAFVGVMVACSKMEPSLPAEDATLDGPVVGLTAEQNRRFLSGDRAFNGQVFTEKTGLGPLFVATSCGSCHAGDGKGHPFVTLTRFGQLDSTGNKFLALGGPQLQHKSIPGYTPEQVPAGATSTQLVAPMNAGFGFIEGVSDADIMAMADPTDANGDGISGVPNWNKIPAYVYPAANALSQNGKYIGRFGKKGATHNLLQQTANAYNQDIGITSAFEPKDAYSRTDIDPEIGTQTIYDVVFYLTTLKTPVQRKPNDPAVQQGKQVFINIGCEACHKQTLKTGNSDIAALSNTTFHPYTDLLLHDMGPGLDDGYTEGSATTAEWRTPPLWGLGLAPKSQGGQYFLLHDGRARSIEDAIQLHGGEAGQSAQRFGQLSETDRNALLEFLKSL